MRGPAAPVAAALCLAGLTPSPAHAQAASSPAAVPDWPQTRLEQRDPAIMSLYILAVCLESRKRGAVEALLATPRGSLEEIVRLREVMPTSTDCPMRTTRLTIRNHDLVRGAVAEAIYNRARTQPRTAAALPFEGQRDGPDRAGAAAGVAQCAVRRSPLLAHAVVSANAGSQRERQALLALRDTFMGCLPAGTRLTASRLLMRTLIAEQLYHASRSFRDAFANS